MLAPLRRLSVPIVRSALSNGFASRASNKRNKMKSKIANSSPSSSLNADDGLMKLPEPDSVEGYGRIVAVTSGKGGVGKTTSAASFAMVRHGGGEGERRLERSDSSVPSTKTTNNFPLVASILTPSLIRVLPPRMNRSRFVL